jgi:hypothetical protein
MTTIEFRPFIFGIDINTGEIKLVFGDDDHGDEIQIYLSPDDAAEFSRTLGESLGPEITDQKITKLIPEIKIMDKPIKKPILRLVRRE